MFGAFAAIASALQASADAEDLMERNRKEWEQIIQAQKMGAPNARIEQPEVVQRREELQRHRAAIRDAEYVEFKEIK